MPSWRRFCVVSSLSALHEEPFGRATLEPPGGKSPIMNHEVQADLAQSGSSLGSNTTHFVAIYSDSSRNNSARRRMGITFHASPVVRAVSLFGAPHSTSRWEDARAVHVLFVEHARFRHP